MSINIFSGEKLTQVKVKKRERSLNVACSINIHIFITLIILWVKTVRWVLNLNFVFIQVQSHGGKAHMEAAENVTEAHSSDS